MSLKERIDKLKPYLLAYNVSMEDGVQYAVLRVPQNWTIPAEDIDKTYGVKVRAIDGGTCFLADINDGHEVLFDSLDHVVELNVKIQERMALLKTKVEELKKLFISEDLERLKTLEFTFKPQKKGAKKSTKPAVDVSAGIDPPSDPAALAEIQVPEATPVTEAVIPELEKPKNDSNGGSLIDFVEDSIEQ